MTATPCVHCAAPITDGYLCRACTVTLATRYGDLAALVGELATTAYRRDRIAAPSLGIPSGGRERPLPFKDRAARLMITVRGHVVAIAATHGIAVRVASDRPRATAAILHELRATSRHDAASNPAVRLIMDTLGDDIEEIRNVIDLPTSHRYLGRCDGCGSEMYAERDAREHACRGVTCAAVYVVDNRIAELLERCRDVVASPGTIATALTSLEVPVTAERISQWRHRGRLTPRTLNGPARHPWYRVGDVIDLLMQPGVKRR